MMYSVWNASKRAYDYYETSQPGPTHAPPAAHVSMVGGLGATPDEAAWRLPTGARKVGSGATARGRIASLGSLETTRDTLVIGAILVAGYLIGRKVLR